LGKLLRDKEGKTRIFEACNRSRKKSCHSSFCQSSQRTKRGNSNQVSGQKYNNDVDNFSFFEKKNNVSFNSVAIIDADGTNLGIYRKSHIPDGPGYEEKFYFTPGDTGFKVWATQFGKIGVGICWDQVQQSNFC
jgi:predicted amidohydrolase